MSKEQIFQEAMNLEEKDRELLATELLLSIHHTEDAEIERAWMEEAERRLDRILDGSDPTYDGREVIQQLRSSQS